MKNNNSLMPAGGAMAQQEWMAQFDVGGRLFTLSFRQHEFNLALKREFVKSPAQRGINAWLAFADEPVIDDANLGINAFEVMQKARAHICRYVEQHQPAYFCFHASTSRKERIYPRFALRLAADLPDYSLNFASGSFYFYRQD